jgi:murein DD-endopeptidase MepM/ murein hydrolase activator NlpD
MNLRYLFLSLTFASSVTAVHAQSLDHMRELLQQIQQEIDGLEKEQAQTLKPQRSTQPVESTEYTNDVIAVDTLPSGNDAVMIVLFNDNTWRYLRNREYVQDNDVYTRCWDTTKLFPYRDVVALSDLPGSVDIELVDSLKSYHYPYKTTVRSKFGMRHRRKHQGVDLPLHIGDPIYAAFSGQVRISFPTAKSGGYGNLVIIRHDNGLETFYGHLSQRIVQPGEWVEAGQIIGYGGSTGRSTGPHLHFETRYCGQAFDPERLIDFQTGNLRRETFLLKKSYLDIHSSASQDFSDEEAEANEAKRAEEAKKAEASAQYYRVKSGDTLGRIAARNKTTVARLCQLNNISRNTTLSIGRRLRIR